MYATTYSANPLPKLMQWLPPSLISLLLVTPMHAQSFATGLGVGMRATEFTMTMTDFSRVDLGVRYKQFEILGHYFHYSRRMNLGGQYHLSLWKRDRFRVYGFGRVVFGVLAGEIPNDGDRFHLAWGVFGAGVELPLHRSARSRGFVVSLDLEHPVHRIRRFEKSPMHWVVEWWPQFGVGLYYYFF